MLELLHEDAHGLRRLEVVEERLADAPSGRSIALARQGRHRLGERVPVDAGFLVERLVLGRRRPERREDRLEGRVRIRRLLRESSAGPGQASGSYCSRTSSTDSWPTPVRRDRNSGPTSAPRSGSTIVAEVAMQVTSSADLPANARSRRTRHATSAPVAPEYVCASSRTTNRSGAPVKSSKSCWRVSSSSSWFAFVIRIRGFRSRISCSLAHSSNGHDVLVVRAPPAQRLDERVAALALRRGAGHRPDPGSTGVEPDVHAVRDPRAGEQQPQAIPLIRGERVHRVDEHRDEPLLRAVVAQPQAVVDDRVEERLRLARARAGRDEDVLAVADGPQRLLLVREELRELGDPRRGLDGSTPSAARSASVGALRQAPGRARRTAPS